jgi:hypothetical protein
MLDHVLLSENMLLGLGTSVSNTSSWSTCILVSESVAIQNFIKLFRLY